MRFFWKKKIKGSMCPAPIGSAMYKMYMIKQIKRERN